MKVQRYKSKYYKSNKLRTTVIQEISTAVKLCTTVTPSTSFHKKSRRIETKKSNIMRWVSKSVNLSPVDT